MSLNVADTARALEFYRDVLGMRELERPDFPFGGAWLDAGSGLQVHLIEADVPPDAGQHVAFRVDALDEAVDRLRAAGIAVEEPRPVGGTAIRQTFFHDPDGNRIEFTHPAG